MFWPPASLPWPSCGGFAHFLPLATRSASPAARNRHRITIINICLVWSLAERNENYGKTKSTGGGGVGGGSSVVEVYLTGRYITRIDEARGVTGSGLTWNPRVLGVTKARVYSSAGSNTRIPMCLTCPRFRTSHMSFS